MQKIVETLGGWWAALFHVLLSLLLFLFYFSM